MLILFLTIFNSSDPYGYYGGRKTSSASETFGCGKTLSSFYDMFNRSEKFQHINSLLFSFVLEFVLFRTRFLVCLALLRLSL